ncbi:hypothetical protein [Nostoc sp. DedQUE07]|uniref:hypothetical protein n=1 Tax=Nostoc sp. DedQUE07 TaxID=3075392 RepID=UPI002AD4EC13|nr:hypothetical protein [Nostoc sp. DedQUE07]MDZ8131908.1 hypothetical protein [Nostoc sp. DedQUE07]
MQPLLAGNCLVVSTNKSILSATLSAPPTNPILLAMDNPISIKCLSIEQPIAWMLFHGKSMYSQNYLISHRGLTLIHAGNINKRLATKLMPRTLLSTQVIIGSIEIVGCRWSDQPQEGCDAYSYHWYFEKPSLWDKEVPFVAKNPFFDIPFELIESHGLKI